MKHRFLYIVLLLLTSAIGVWAQEPDPEPINLTSNANGTEWTLAEMPAYHVKLEVEYYPVVKRTTTGENPTDYYYLSLAEAIAAAQDGETITMLDDENLGTTSVTINKNVIIDLNGHTLTYTGAQYALTVYNYKTVIIQASGTGENPGGISSTANGWIILNSGTLTISGGAFSSSYPSIDNYGTLTVEGGSITSSNDDAIYNQGSLTVNGGSITGYSGINSNGYYNPSLTITGGSITATNENGNAILIQTGTFNLRGNPTISGTTADIYLKTGTVINIPAALTAPMTTGETPVADPWTVKSDNIETTPTTPYTFTTGWSTKMGTAAPAAYFTYYDNTAGVATHLTRGGEAQFVIPNVSITTVGDNPTTLYYPTLAAAIAGASSTSVETITMLANENLGTTSVTINQDVTLDLNGYTLTCSSTAGEAITVSAGKTVTIQDSGTNGTVSNSLGDAICNKGTLIISSGFITGNIRAITNDENASLTVNGGTITGINQSGVYNYGTNANLTVTGGTITGTSNYAICINSGTFNLSGNPTISGPTADIYLPANKVINIPADLTAPMTTGETPVADPWTVKSDNIETTATTPYIFTTGFSTYCLDGTDVADPASYFACTTANITTRLTSGEAEFVQYVELDANVAATVPVITNNGQDGDGTRTVSLDEGNVWIGDQLSVATTATPGITWQWYRVSGTTETEIDGETASTYTLTAEDLGYTIIAKATQPANIGGTDNPSSDVTVASAATVAVVKKDNFGTLTAADITTDADSKVDYIGVTITNASTGVEYLVVADGTTAVTDAQWALATTPTADGSLTLNQFAAVSGTEASLTNMLPGTAYDLYYRLVETADTKHGTTATTNEKPVNEKNADITTATWNYQFTTAGVTYELSHDNTTGMATTTTTAKVVAIPAEASTVHTGYNEATILASIPADNAALVERIDVWSVLGYDVTSAVVNTGVFSNAIAVDATAFDTEMSLSNVGSTIGTYGYLKAMDDDMYAWLTEGTSQSTCTEEGYQIYMMNSGYYTVCNAADSYAMAGKSKRIEETLSTILTIGGLSGDDQGAVAFKDKTGTALPVAASGPNKDKIVAAPGQKVTVQVTLPAGFGFKADADNKKINVSDGTSTTAYDLAVTSNERVWTAEFTMPSKNVTVSFKEASPIDGMDITFDYTAPTDGTGAVAAETGSPTEDGTVKALQTLAYTLTPTTPAADATGAGYALTALGLPNDITPTIVLASDETTAVTLPTEQSVKVTFTVPATYTASNTVTFAPVFTNTYENISFAAGNTTYKYSDTQGIALHGENAYLKFWTVSSVSGSTVTATEIESKQIPAGTPLIVKNTNGADIIARMDFGTYDAVTVANEFKGTAVAKALNAEGNGPWNWAANTEYYGFNGLDDFIWINAAGDVAAHKCWLEISTGNSAHQLTINWDGNATGIKQVDSLQFSQRECGVAKTVESYYDLNGRKLQSMPTKKGVYILNGQKVVVK